MRKNKNWFTLIELMISMTIFFIIVVMSYANYAYFQNIAKVKIALKEISQSINEARNLAISWYDKSSVNQSIWVLFDLSDNNSIKFYSYNYNSWITLDDNYVFKTKKIQDWVWINDISWKTKVMIYFSAILAKPEIYYFESDVKNDFTTDQLDFKISYKDAKSWPLTRTLKYIKNTNVVDY